MVYILLVMVILPPNFFSLKERKGGLLVGVFAFTEKTPFFGNLSSLFHMFACDAGINSGEWFFSLPTSCH